MSCASLQDQQKSEPAKQRNEGQTDPEPTIVSLAQQQGATKQTDPTEQQTPHWYEFLWTEIASNWAMAMIAAITGGIVVWQAWETRSAVQATRDSITQTGRHFELLNAQWLDTGAFFVQAMDVPDVTTSESALHWMLTFKIQNPTPLKVQLTSIECFIDGDQTTLFTGKTIGPRDGMTFEIPGTKVSDENAARIRANTVTGVLWVGRINYTNALGKTVVHEFGKRGVVNSRDKTRLRDPILGDLHVVISRIEASQREQVGAEHQHS
jgi:hypothetical protein